MTAPVATVNGSVYADSDSGPYYTSADGQVFGPVGMRYRSGGGGEISSFIGNLNFVITPDQVTEMDLSSFPDLY